MLRPIPLAPKETPPPKKSRNLKIPPFLRKKWVLALLLVGICLIVGLWVRQSTSRNATSVSKTPEYTTVLPKGKDAEALGGWKRISPPENDPVFAYSDTIGKVPVSVSQQPLPATFKNDIDNKVAEVAQKFNATNKLDADGTTVYIGTSAKGPQSVIFTKNNLLILIKSANKIKDAAWIDYIKTLG